MIKKRIIRLISSLLIICIILGAGGYLYKLFSVRKGIVTSGYVSVYEKLEAGVPVNVLIVGDSIAQGTGASEGKSWAKLLMKQITDEYGSECNMTNVSMGGNTSIAGVVRERTIEESLEYDLAIICYGENDADDEAFASNYEAIIRGIKSQYGGCNIICVLESSQREYTNKINQIIEIADYYGIPVADTIAAFNNSGYAYEELVGAPDDLTHPNDLGHSVYCDAISEVIRNQVEASKTYDEKVRRYDHLVYFPKSEFSRVGISSFTIRVNPTVSDLAIYRSYITGNNDVKIYVDGQLITEESNEWNYGFSQAHIYQITSEPVDISKSITIKFSTYEQAKEFEGIALFY